MLRKRPPRLFFAMSLATMAVVGAADAQTKCRGYVTTVVLGEVCAWGCGDKNECNGTVGACADRTVVVLWADSG